jgi:hypothetical protein
VMRLEFRELHVRWIGAPTGGRITGAERGE